MNSNSNTHHFLEGNNSGKTITNNDSPKNAEIDIYKEQEIQNYINEKKELYNSLMLFLFNSNYDGNDYPIMNGINKLTQKEDLEQFLRLIVNIANNHHRIDGFYKQIFRIIQYYKNEIKQTFSNSETFDIFESNKMIVLFLLETKILTIDDQIYKEIKFKTETNGNRYCHFFYPEIKEFDFSNEIEEELKSINPNILSSFDENRHKGENESRICSLIREDSVEAFISHVNRFNV